MKRSLLLLALVFFFAGQATAQTGNVPSYDAQTSGFFYFAPEVLGFFPEKDHLRNNAFVGGRVGFQICPNLAAEIETGWIRLKVKDDLGSMNTEPLMANVRYNVMGVDNPWDVFLMGGIGVAFNRLNTDVPGVDSSNTFAIQTGAGFEWRFNPNLSVVVDIRYFWNDPEIDFHQHGVGSLKNDSLVVGGGLCWNFR